MHRRLFLGSACAALGASSLLWPAWGQGAGAGGRGERVQGSGRLATEMRALPDFQHLRLEDSLSVAVRSGAQNSVSIRADDNILPLVEAAVQDGTLRLRYQRGVTLRTQMPVTIELTCKGLESVALNGSGDLDLSDPQADSLTLTLAGSGQVNMRRARLGRLTVQLAGSGDMRLAGQADAIMLALAGSGNILADALVARNAEVRLSGSGNVRVQARDRLSVQLSGSGNVHHVGQPTELLKRVTGSGQVMGER